MAFTGVVSGVRSSQSYPAAQLKPDIERALFLLEPYQTPFLQFLFFSAGVKQKKVINKTGKYSWFEDEYFPHQAALTAAFTAPGAATGDLTIANYAYFKQNDIILIEDSDQMAYVTATPSSSTVAISSLDASTNLLAAANGTNVKILGNLNNEYAGTPTAMSTQAVEKNNYLTIFTEAVATTGRDEAGEAWTDGETHDEQVEKKIKELKLKVERFFMLSTATPATRTVSSYLWTYGNGALGRITTNVSTYTAGAMTLAQWNAHWLKVFAKGSKRRIHYVGSQQLSDINAMIADKVQLKENITTEFGVQMSRIYTDTGIVDLTWDPVLDGKYTNYGISLDPEDVVLRYMANDKKGSRRFRVEENVETPGTDGSTTKILMDVGIQIPNEEKQGYLKAA